jgi:hypothetical protein
MDNFDKFVDNMRITLIAIIATILSVIILIGAVQLVTIAHHSKNHNVQSLKTVKGK